MVKLRIRSAIYVTLYVLAAVVSPNYWVDIMCCTLVGFFVGLQVVMEIDHLKEQSEGTAGQPSSLESACESRRNTGIATPREHR